MYIVLSDMDSDVLAIALGSSGVHGWMVRACVVAGRSNRTLPQWIVLKFSG